MRERQTKNSSLWPHFQYFLLVNSCCQCQVFPLCFGWLVFVFTGEDDTSLHAWDTSFWPWRHPTRLHWLARQLYLCFCVFVYSCICVFVWPSPSNLGHIRADCTGCWQDKRRHLGSGVQSLRQFVQLCVQQCLKSVHFALSACCSICNVGSGDATAAPPNEKLNHRELSNSGLTSLCWTQCTAQMCQKYVLDSICICFSHH